METCRTSAVFRWPMHWPAPWTATRQRRSLGDAAVARGYSLARGRPTSSTGAGDGLLSGSRTSRRCRLRYDRLPQRKSPQGTARGLQRVADQNRCSSLAPPPPRPCRGRFRTDASRPT
jgi:hypothetical protein